MKNTTDSYIVSVDADSLSHPVAYIHNATVTYRAARKEPCPVDYGGLFQVIP